MRQHTGPDDWREANRARWDERGALHTASDYYDQDRFRRVHEHAMTMFQRFTGRRSR